MRAAVANRIAVGQNRARFCLPGKIGFGKRVYSATK